CRRDAASQQRLLKWIPKICGKSREIRGFDSFSIFAPFRRKSNPAASRGLAAKHCNKRVLHAKLTDDTWAGLMSFAGQKARQLLAREQRGSNRQQPAFSNSSQGKEATSILGAGRIGAGQGASRARPRSADSLPVPAQGGLRPAAPEV